MDLRRLQYFVVLTEEQHFGRAARRLYMAQPALTQAIHRLEAEVHAQLVDRSTRGFRLTPAGQALLEAARRILAEVDLAERTVQRTVDGSLGTLRIGCMSAGLFGVLSRTLPLLRARTPTVSIVVSELPTVEQVARLRAGTIDVGLLRPPIDGDDLAILDVMRDPYVAVLPEDHPLAGRSEIDLGELAGEDFVYFPREMAAGPFDRIIAACEVAGFSPRLVHRAGRPDSATALVSCGLGVALVSGTMRAAHVERVRYVELAGEPVLGRIAAAWRRDDDSAVLAAFRSALDEVRD